MILNNLIPILNIGTVLELFNGIVTQINTHIGSSEKRSDIKTKQNFILEDDPMCGVTTGGKEECFWDCNIIPTPMPSTYENLITNPECLRDTSKKLQILWLMA